MVCIANGNKWKATLRTCYESFKWSVIPFDLTNTPMAFQQFMNNIFSNFLDVYVMIYLSTQITCPNTTGMLKKYSNIFTRLAFMPKQKYEFHSELVEYLGYILSPPSLTMSNDKVKIIQFFLGLTNFYYQFIFNYSDTVILLICLT